MASIREHDAMDVDEKPPGASAGGAVIPESSSLVAHMGAGLSKKFESARDRVSKEKYDVDAWQVMINEVERKSVVVARPVYEQFLRVFPTSAKHWKMYIEQEQAAGNADAVEALFKRCLKSTPNIDLWRKYVKYVQETTSKLPNSNNTILHAFELAVNTVGYDINSEPLWADYLSFVQNQNTDGDAKAENIKLDLLRKIYQRCVVLPIHNLEVLWRDYTVYENNRSKALATALLNDIAPKYMDARAACRERKNHLEGIQRANFAVPPTGNKKEIAQVQMWKRLIEFEKRNVLNIEPSILHDRVVFSFNQALLVLYRYPEAWYDLAMYEMSIGGVESALAVYERAASAVDSLLLRFAHADLLESLGKLDGAKTVYDELLRTKPAPLVYISYMRFARRSLGVEEARRVFFMARKSAQATADVYIAAAQMEFEVNKDSNAALKIFSLGMAKFSGDFAFMFAYVDLLERLNDDANIRAVFEQMVASVSSDRAIEVWSRYLTFERSRGSLASVITLEERCNAVLNSQSAASSDDKGNKAAEEKSNGPSIVDLVQRQKYRDLWPCTMNEMQSFVGAVNAEDLAKTRRLQKAEEKKRQSSHSLPLGQRKNPLRDAFDRPDIAQMTPFKMEAFFGVDIQLPSALSLFINDLPRGHWDGGHIEPEIIIEILKSAPLKQPELTDDDKRGTKRKYEGDDDALGDAPKNDVFRARQTAKLAKVAEGDKALGEVPVR